MSAAIRPPNPLSTAGLDRLGLIRKHPDRLAEHFASTDVRAVPICGGKVCVSTDHPPQLIHPDVDELDDAWLLGACDGVTYVAVDIDPAANDLGPDARLAGLREVATMLPPLEGNLLAMATGLAIWHDTHRFCGKCGAETAVDWAGHRRRCDSCGREHYPRTDPAIIVLVTHEDRALLARNPMWPRGFASVLAGFVEPGESLEDAVAREVKEEVGVDVAPGGVAYHSSQPWPFPASVMLGFTAAGASDELDCDPEEIADACWYTREELANGAIGLPPALSISRRLIDDWLAEGEETP
ncbi:MAG TPA: NAD(+) diphosphatase [Acidimicrobiales bacterium]|nr:NAD(+) diphosphatase [Acidimicrobiales bacterium]